jgi:Fe-S cluster assembly protein SufB
MATVDLDLGAYKLGWHDSEDEYVFKPRKGLTEEIIREMSRMKGEPEWMLAFRLKSYKRFLAKPIPTWGGGGALDDIDFDDIYYYVKPMEGQAKDWDMVPDSIKETYEKLGIPEAERKYLAGVTAQYECLRGDTRVHTTRGLIPIKDVHPGDRVFSLDEDTGDLTVHAVTAAAQTDVRQTYRVTVGGRRRRTIHATDNHPVLTLADVRKPGRTRARYARRWKTVAELEVGDLVAVARDVPEYGAPYCFTRLDDTPAHYPEWSSADVMWLMGYWVGGGCTSLDSGTSRVELAAPGTDEVVRAEITRVARQAFGVRATHPDRWRVALASQALVRWFEAQGLLGGSSVRRIPDWVFGLPPAQRLAFLAGCVDAAGSVSPDHHGTVMTTTDRALADQVAELATLCGLQPCGPDAVESAHPEGPERQVAGFWLALGGEARVPVRNPRHLGRLGRRARSDTSAAGTTFRSHLTPTLGFARVVEIEEADVAPVYDIEVDGPHNFVAEGIVVHNSEVVYHKNREDLEEMGVLFCDMDTAVREYPEIVQEYFGTVIPPNDNKFAALNSAVWSGGSFIYVPPGVTVEQPLQAYFRINSENMGQFERTLIIVDEGGYCHYVEGCSAPIYSTDSLHSAVVEIVVKHGGRCRYTTIQNWSNNVYNLVTKRAAAYADATMEWIDGNLGSKLTMKYPAVWLMEPGAHGEVLSIAFAGEGQHQDAGAKMVHAAPNTTSTIVSKSISKNGGRAGYRGLVRVEPGAENAKSFVRCDALILDEKSRSDTYPYMEIEENNAEIGHEATVSKVGEEQLFYLMSRGLNEEQATSMIVAGFIEPIVKELPMEYAVEMNRLIELNMAEAGAIG